MATSDGWQNGRQAKVASALTRLGLIGFWVQLIFLTAVVLLGGYVLVIVGGSAGIGNVLTFLGLALPVFTTYWCWHYTRLGRSMTADAASTAPAHVSSLAWIGVWAGTAGGIVSLLSLFGAASALLVTLLANPQVGLQISPAEGGFSAYTISAVDAVSIMSLLLTLTAELLVVAVSLRLVFLVSSARTEDARA